MFYSKHKIQNWIASQSSQRRLNPKGLIVKRRRLCEPRWSNPRRSSSSVVFASPQAWQSTWSSFLF